tara:strand:+ start:195 stop:365 length:171 start_codon:yes stop_codon:yes gene_type:complete
MTFDKETLLAFIAMYLDARENKVEQFKFAGQDVLTDYAKYMIQQATNEWGNTNVRS